MRAAMKKVTLILIFLIIYVLIIFLKIRLSKEVN